MGGLMQPFFGLLVPGSWNAVRARPHVLSGRFPGAYLHGTRVSNEGVLTLFSTLIMRKRVPHFGSKNLKYVRTGFLIVLSLHGPLVQNYCIDLPLRNIFKVVS